VTLVTWLRFQGITFGVIALASPKRNRVTGLDFRLARVVRHCVTVSDMSIRINLPKGTITIRLPQTDLDQLDAYAKEHDLTRSQVVRRAIRLLLTQA
jgi:oligoribonuclease (3'-5' exoribonuclease)